MRCICMELIMLYALLLICENLPTVSCLQLIMFILEVRLVTMPVPGSLVLAKKAVGFFVLRQRKEAEDYV